MSKKKKVDSGSRSKGRPSKFTEEIRNEALRLANAGKTNEQISHIIGICPKTFDNWKGRYPDFLRALKEAKQNADELVKASLFRRATGYYHDEEKIFYNAKSNKVTRVNTVKHYPPDTGAAIFWLKNRQPKEWRESYQVTPTPPDPSTNRKKTFEEFCETAGYPKPFEKQNEMRAFIIDEELARLLLGARGYGKTDYAVVLGLAYEIYEEWFEGWVESTTLIVTKSEERNAAMLDEIAKACEANGVIFEKKNSTCLRVAGLVGKDHSVSTVTVGATSIRGRHPKRVIMDDPVTEEDVSEATRKRVQRVYNELNKLTQNVAVIGQPVHKADLYETLRPLVKRLEVPHGSIPELDVDLEAMALAGVSQESISASYHLKVVNENPTPFENVKLIETFPRKDSVAFIDPSFEGGDYTALSIATSHIHTKDLAQGEALEGVAVKGRVWKKAWNHCLDEMVQELLACNVKRVCFETNCLGDQPVIMLRQALPAHIGVIGKKSTGFKHSRIMNAGVMAHLIFLAKSSDRKYIEQITQYEYGAKNDDAPDSLASLLEWLGLIRGKKV